MRKTHTLLDRQTERDRDRERQRQRPRDRYRNRMRPRDKYRNWMRPRDRYRNKKSITSFLSRSASETPLCIFLQFLHHLVPLSKTTHRPLSAAPNAVRISSAIGWKL